MAPGGDWENARDELLDKAWGSGLRQIGVIPNMEC